MKAYNDPEKPWYKLREPFSNEEKWETEAGTRVAVGETVLAKPKFVSQRLPAVVDTIYWDPMGLPGGDFDHRGEKIGKGDTADPETAGDFTFENLTDYECILKVQFRFDVPEDHEYSHMDGKTHRTEAYNLDFVVGDAPEIRRDRANCNTEPI